MVRANRGLSPTSAAVSGREIDFGAGLKIAVRVGPGLTISESRRRRWSSE